MSYQRILLFRISTIVDSTSANVWEISEDFSPISKSLSSCTELVSTFKLALNFSYLCVKSLNDISLQPKIPTSISDWSVKKTNLVKIPTNQNRRIIPNIVMTDSFKLVLLGSSGVGKSSLINRFCKDFFTEDTTTTIGADFQTADISISNSQKVGFQIWDTAGQEIYDSLTPMYFRGASAAVVVYDITNIDTLHRAKKWVIQLRKETDDSRTKGDIVIALCGNKCDRYEARQVGTEEARAYATKEGLIFFETSAKTTDNVQNVFLQIAKQLMTRKPEKKEKVDTVQPHKKQDPNQPTTTQPGCCG
jgi:Ras-related protein Rab-5C